MSNQQTTGQNEILNPDNSKTPVAFATSTPNAVKLNPAVTASAYSTGQVMGGILTFLNILRMPGGSGMVFAALMTTKTAFAGPADLLLFSKLPTGTYTDQAALNLSAADAANLLGILHLSDLTAGGATVAALIQGSLTQQPIPVYNNEVVPTQNLYGVLVVRAAVTPTATTDMNIKLTVDQN